MEEEGVHSGEKEKQEEEKEKEKLDEVCRDSNSPPPAQHSRRQMTPEKKGHTCPLCWEVYVDIAQHLKFKERVYNKEERTLLCKLSHKQ